MCASLDGATCVASATNWNSGWLVYTSASASASATVSTISTILRYKKIDHQGAEIRLKKGNAGKDDHKVVFKPTSVGLLSTAFTATNFIFYTQISGCHSPLLAIKRKIKVALSGGITVSTQACTQ
ncbi:MAG: hypothetical protein OFPII_21270 [Osedax symbiont Rs1]|nr:MAG: hypothetical protein OFPII_21270 [Osedax symbiont Rs1]